MKILISSVLFLLLTASAVLCQAQKKISDAESKELQSALAETSNSPSEIVHTLEKHLQKFPDSAQKDEIVRAITKAAMDAGDKPRILQYGEMCLRQNMDQPL